MDLHLETGLKVHNLTKEEYEKLPEQLQKDVRLMGKKVNYFMLYPSAIPKEIKQWLKRQGVR